MTLLDFYMHKYASLGSMATGAGLGAVGGYFVAPKGEKRFGTIAGGLAGGLTGGGMHHIMSRLRPQKAMEAMTHGKAALNAAANTGITAATQAASDKFLKNKHGLVSKIAPFADDAILLARTVV